MRWSSWPASPEEQSAGWSRATGCREAEARARLAAQWPIDEKVRRADYVIRTDGGFAETDAEIARVYRS